MLRPFCSTWPDYARPNRGVSASRWGNPAHYTPAYRGCMRAWLASIPRWLLLAELVWILSVTLPWVVAVSALHPHEKLTTHSVAELVVGNLSATVLAGALVSIGSGDPWDRLGFLAFGGSLVFVLVLAVASSQGGSGADGPGTDIGVVLALVAITVSTTMMLAVGLCMGLLFKLIRKRVEL